MRNRSDSWPIASCRHSGGRREVSFFCSGNSSHGLNRVPDTVLSLTAGFLTLFIWLSSATRVIAQPMTSNSLLRTSSDQGGNESVRDRIRDLFIKLHHADSRIAQQSDEHLHKIGLTSQQIELGRRLVDPDPQVRVALARSLGDVDTATAQSDSCRPCRCVNTSRNEPHETDHDCRRNRLWTLLFGCHVPRVGRRGRKEMTLAGRVGFVGLKVEPISRKVRFWADVVNRDNLLRDGSTATLTIQTESESR